MPSRQQHTRGNKQAYKMYQRNEKIWNQETTTNNQEILQPELTKQKNEKKLEKYKQNPQKHKETKKVDVWPAKLKNEKDASVVSG